MFFTESGNLIEKKKLCLKVEGYIILAKIYRDRKLVKCHETFLDSELSMAKKILQSKAKQQKGEPL